MSSNKTFFKQAQEGSLSLVDLFSEALKPHSYEETSSVLTAGTALTTPREEDILRLWKKPFLFVRFFCAFLTFLLIAFLMGSMMEYPGGYYLLLIGIPFLVPATLLLLVWEMNIPRNISIYEVIKITALGGALSFLVTLIGYYYSGDTEAVWAGLIEEPAKLLVICLILHKKNYRYTLNGALIGAAVGTGFAIMESLVYVITAIGNSMQAILSMCIEDGYVLADVAQNFASVWYMGVSASLNVAISRAITAISGHGVFAALYGHALVRAKGNTEFQALHLLNPRFLMYFAVAVLLHAIHNYGPNLGLPVLFDGFLPSEYLMIATVSVALLLHALHVGVNEVVAIGISHYGSSFTQAVVDPLTDGKTYQFTAPVRELKIICISGPHKGEKFRCKEGKSFTIGRENNPKSICVSNCTHVSGTHCRIDFSDGHIYVTDLNSRNGTYLDGNRLIPNQPVLTNKNFVLKLANDECKFTIQVQ